MIWQPFNPGRRLRALLPGLMILFAPCFAESATLLWDRNPETNVVGYRVYVGKVSRAYDSVLDMGNSTSAVVPTTPGLNYFAVTAYDQDGLESSYSAEVTYVDGVLNTPPAATADAYATPRNVTLNIPASGVLANDSDPESQPLTAQLVGNPANGSLTLHPNGSFTYTPAANYTGPDSFTYQCHDGLAASPAVTVNITVTAPTLGNTAPVAQNNSYTTPKNTTLTVSASGVLANDSDADGQPLTAILVNAPGQGTFSLNANGGFTYTPLNQFVGTDTFQYAASDGLTSSVATVTITVTGTATSNTPPVTQPDTYIVAKDQTLVLSAAAGVLANDHDVDGHPLSVLQYGNPAHGDVNLYSDGGFNYTPEPGYTGTDTFGYRVNDGLATTLPVTVTIIVTGAPPVNAAPVAAADSFSLAKNSTLNIPAAGVLANDSDANNNPLTALLVTAPASGTLSLNANGGFTYTPAAGFTGNASFTYRANDGLTNSAPATVTLNVTNTPPVANADSYATLKNIGLNIAASGVLANDSDANSDSLTASVVTAPANGTLTLNANGGFNYTPAANFTGADSFTYRVTDGTAFSAPATVSLTINNSNGAPVAVADTFTLAKNSALNIAANGVLANDSDPDGNPLTAMLVTAPASGTLSLSANGGFTYTPTAGFTGNASFTYRANDGTANSANTTVTLTVTNIPPVAVADSFSTSKNIGLTVAAAAGLLGNDSDANGDALTASVVTSPAHGTLSLNANGGFTFTPAANYTGPDSFTYRVSDGTAFSTAATVSLTINNSNAAPVAVANSYSLSKNTTLNVAAAGVLANDSDVDGQPLTASLVSAPASGTLTLNANGSFSYTPTAGFTGSASFTYRATDGTAFSANATVTLNVTNNTPVAVADSFVTLKNIGLNIPAAGVLANDTDVNSDTLTASVVANPTKGTLTLSANGGFTYTPNANYVGADSFTYRVNDGTVFSANATVSLTINNSNGAPVAVADSYTLAKNSTLNIAAAGVLANDSDPDANPLTAALVSSPASGSVTLNANGSFTYTAAPNFTGVATFTYRASDGLSNSLPATVTLNITNTPPVAAAESYALAKNSTLNIAASGVLANDSDPNGDTLTASLVSAPVSGSLTLNPNGSFSYTAAPGFTGSASFTYRATDGAAFSANATVTLNVTNIPPVAVADSFTTLKNIGLTVPVGAGLLNNDSDANGDSLSASVVTSPAHGSLSLNANGSFLFTPAASYVGPDSFTYRVSDGTAFSAAATVSITINNSNGAPAAVGDNFELAKNSTLTISANGVLGNDSDPDGDSITGTLITSPANGTLTFNANGGFTYRPTTGFSGGDSFTYRISDGSLNSANALVTLNITNTPPVANEDAYATLKNIGLTVPATSGLLTNDTDPNGDALTASVVANPAHGTLVLNANGGFTFTPAANYVGDDSFTYRVSDGADFSAPVSVALTINNSNAAPVAVGESYTLAKNGSLTVPANGVLANDSDLDGQTLTASVVTAPASGTLTLNASGGFTYTPAAGFTGNASFTYRASDGAAFSANATVTLIVTNTPPVANGDSYVTLKNIGLSVTAGAGLLTDDTDANGDALTASVVTPPAHGALTLNANGSFTFQPAANYTGADSFTYRVSDGAAFSAPATVGLTINNSNGAPVVVAESYSLARGGVLVVPATGVLANDSDPDGDVIFATLVSSPTQGALTLNASGAFSYTPNANYVGSDSFTYRATDGSANSANATVTLLITNAPPVANGESYATAKNLPLVIAANGVLANDTDEEGNALTAAVVGPATGGIVVLNVNGGFTFSPAAGFTGTASFNYRANDGVSNSASATVSIAVTNTAPVANDDGYATSKNIGLTINAASGVLGDDTDANNDTLTASLVTAPEHGTLTLSANGSFTFTPAANYVGLDSFTYRAHDGAAFSEIATVTLVISASNGAPVAVAESFTLAKNNPLVVAPRGLLANDSDPDGDMLNAVLVLAPTRGTLALSADGGFTYVPGAGNTGTDSFTYRASDGSASSANVIVNLSITNTPPVAEPDSFITSKNIGLTVGTAEGLLVNDTDLNGDVLTASVLANPAHGSLTLNANGGFTFTPAANYVGPDSFTYRVRDGALFSPAATVTLTIVNSNAAPVANADSYALAKNSTLNIPALGVLANDSDADGQPITASLVSAPANGSITLNANGNFIYTPSAGFTGVDSFVYRASDGTVNSAGATVTLTVTNTPPVANADGYTTLKNIGLNISAEAGLLADDMDANGDSLTVSLVTAPPHGTLVLNDNGSFTFTPTANYTGSGTFTYRVSDGTAFSANATVTITVNNSNTAPVAVADTYSTPRNTKLTVNTANGLLANDTDVDEEPLAVTLVSLPARGTLTLNSDGSLNYTPTNNFVGQDSFAYRAFDGLTNSATATVTINVQPPPNVAPVARNENYTVTRNTTLTIAPVGVLANDTDGDNNPLIALLAAGPAHGTVTLGTNGGFSYTPVANYAGPDSFTYRAYDGLTNSALATVFITVNMPSNSAPVAVGEHYYTIRGAALTVGAAAGVLANDSDADGNSLTVAVVVPVANGTLLLAPAGSFIYTPRAGFTGVDGFSYRVSDGLASATAVATIHVNEPPPDNVPPVANADRYEGLKNQTLDVPAHSGVLVNDTDANADVLTATLVSTTTQGTLAFSTNGGFTYTPAAEFTGIDSFSYFASDGSNITATMTVTIVVSEPPPENNAPVANPETYNALKNTPLYVSWFAGVLKNDTDADGDPIVASMVSGPEQGTVTLNWNGGFVFTPSSGFTGTVHFTYEADDGMDSSDTTLVTISVIEPVVTNAVPVAISDTYFTVRNVPLEVPATSGVLLNDKDSDDTVLFAGLFLPPTHGTVVLNLDGSFTYTPAAEFTGTDSFAYEVSDGLDISAPTLVTITVNEETVIVGGCVNCFAELDEVMAARPTVFAKAMQARRAVPTNSACAPYGVLVFRTLVPQLGPLHDSAANRALASASDCVAGLLTDDLAGRYSRAASLAPSKYTRSASNYLDTIVQSLASLGTVSNNSSRSKLLVAAGNAFVRADKSLNSGDLAKPSLEGLSLTCTFVRSGQSSRGTFVFGTETFLVEDSNGVPIKTGTYRYTRTAWNTGALLITFDQPTLGYQAGVEASWKLTYGRTKHKISATGLKGTFTIP